MIQSDNATEPYLVGAGRLALRADGDADLSERAAGLAGRAAAGGGRQGVGLTDRRRGPVLGSRMHRAMQPLA